MSQKLNVIALISGGKDSFFSILHCLRNGHEVVALANLYPTPAPGQAANEESQDLNSFMYQTVGHSIIPLYAEALQLPLYRQEITGSAVNTDKDYAAPAGATATETAADAAAPASAPADETECMLRLLRNVLAAHPTATAVCTGAILSTYQRTRVESVCSRLGLVPLGYLWQYPSLAPYTATALLRDMRGVRQEARIVKVASGGVDESFLWADVADPPTVGRLRRAVARFGGEADGAVVGEGGEFETCAVDGPGDVWCGGRIEVEVGERGVMGEGGSAVVEFRGARVVPREEGVEAGSLEDLRIPDLLDVEFEELGRDLLASSKETDLNEGVQQLDITTAEAAESMTLDSIRSYMSASHYTDPQHLTLSGNNLHISNFTAPAYDNPTEQLSSIARRLTALLDQFDVSASDIVHSTLLLRRMSDFVPLNAIYGSLFTKPNPPSRVTVACGDALPEGIDVALSVIVDVAEGGRGRRRGLHVQSRSYWAPANIGPYSQAVAVPVKETSARENPEVVWVAGQIPLVPSSMEMVKAEDAAVVQGAEDSGFAIQTTLSLQHLWRIGRAMDVSWWACGVAYISACGKKEGVRRARIALNAWKGIHEELRPKDENEDEEEVVDVWDLKNRAGMGNALAPETDGRPHLPTWDKVRNEAKGTPTTPSCFVVQVHELPRAADIEWTSPGLSKTDVLLNTFTSSNGFSLHETRSSGAEVSFFSANISSAADIENVERVLGSKPKAVAEDGELEEDQYTVYMARPLPQTWLEQRKPQIVPCKRVWGPDGRELIAAVTVRRYGAR